MRAVHERPLLWCDLPIGRPDATVHNELLLTGWATSPQGVSGVAVQIGERQWNAGYGLDTPAVARRLPEVPRSDRAGYELRIDTSEWKAEQYHVTVAAFDLDGRRSAIQGHIAVLPFKAPATTITDIVARIRKGEIVMALDEQGDAYQASAHPLEISGWAFARGGIESVLVTIDGQIQHEATRPISRPELLRHYGPELAAEAGFVSRLDPSLATGRQAVTVVAVGRDGSAVGLERDVITPADPVPKPPTDSEEPQITGPGEGWAPSFRADDNLCRDDSDRHGGPAFNTERRLRYRLAAALVAPDQEVVDLGCGSGLGTALLAQAGAAKVVGIDSREEEIARGKRLIEDQPIDFRVGLLEATGLPDFSADVVTCLEASDDMSDPDAAVAELRRVLRPGGIAIVATTVKPLAHRDYGASRSSGAAIETALRARFTHVRILRQDTALASVVLGEGELASSNLSIGADGATFEAAAAGQGSGLVAVVSDNELPDLGPVAVLGPTGTVRRLREAAAGWQNRASLAEADAAVSRSEAAIARQQQEHAAWTLGEANLRIGEMAPVAAQLEATREELDAAREARAEAETRIVLLERDLTQSRETSAALVRSLSWRLTRPLRWAKRWGRVPRRARDS